MFRFDICCKCPIKLERKTEKLVSKSGNFFSKWKVEKHFQKWKTRFYFFSNRKCNLEKNNCFWKKQLHKPKKLNTKTHNI